MAIVKNRCQNVDIIKFIDGLNVGSFTKEYLKGLLENLKQGEDCSYVIRYRAKKLKDDRMITVAEFDVINDFAKKMENKRRRTNSLWTSFKNAIKSFFTAISILLGLFIMYIALWLI
ncbi:MAG: hypothetical protein PHD60_07205 [Clostridia bacterium]|nr:hypothetical protein [Clostridia bacterium]